MTAQARGGRGGEVDPARPGRALRVTADRTAEHRALPDLQLDLDGAVPVAWVADVEIKRLDAGVWAQPKLAARRGRGVRGRQAQKHPGLGAVEVKGDRHPAVEMPALPAHLQKEPARAGGGHRFRAAGGAELDGEPDPVRSRLGLCGGGVGPHPEPVGIGRDGRNGPGHRPVLPRPEPNGDGGRGLLPAQNDRVGRHVGEGRRRRCSAGPGASGEAEGGERRRGELAEPVGGVGGQPLAVEVGGVEVGRRSAENVQGRSQARARRTTGGLCRGRPTTGEGSSAGRTRLSRSGPSPSGALPGFASPSHAARISRESSR